MKINFVKIESASISFAIFKKPSAEVLKTTKKLRLSVGAYSKTTVHTSLIWDDACVSVNKAVEGFNTHKTSEFSYVSGGHNVSHYFKKTKKQGLEEYLKYVETILQTLFADLGIDELTVEYTSELEYLFK